MGGDPVLFFRKLAIFVALNLVVVGLGDAAVLHAASIYKDGASIICESKRESVRDGRLASAPTKQGAPTVVVLGDSRALAGVIPRVLDDAVGHGASSLNLALPALPMGPDLYVLRDYVERNGAPAFVVVHLRAPEVGAGLFDQYANQGSTVSEVIAYAVARRDSGVLVNRFNPIAMYESTFRSWLEDALLRPQAAGALRASNEARVGQMLLDRGYYDIREQKMFPSGRLPDDFDTGPAPAEGAPFKLEDDPYVPAFFEYAQREGIRVLLVEVPSRKAPAAERTEMPAYYRAALARYPNVRMANEGWRVKTFPNRLFSDPVHVNPEGAALFTRRVARSSWRFTARSSGARR